MTTCRVQVHSDEVHAVFYGLVECLLQLRLVYIVLILTDSDGFGINLYQFGQRIHQPASDRNCSSDCHVIFGKLVTGDFGSRINGSSLLADYKHGNLAVEALAADKIFRFTTCRPVTDGDGFYLIGFNHLAEFGCRFTGFVDGRMRVNILVMQ